MSRIEDRKQQRREYTNKKGVAYMKASLAVLLALCFGSVAYCLLAEGFAIWHKMQHMDAYQLAMDPYQLDADATFRVVLICSIFCGGGFLLLARSARMIHRASKQLPYVPPVTAATLPNEEVLLRGSDASAQEQSSVLLRGTQSGEETDGEELLRSSQGQDRDGLGQR